MLLTVQHLYNVHIMKTICKLYNKSQILYENFFYYLKATIKAYDIYWAVFRNLVCGFIFEAGGK